MRLYAKTVRKMAEPGNTANFAPRAPRYSLFSASFIPTWDNSPASSDTPVTVYVDDVDITVHGQIDRIDWDQDRNQLAVRDYKTGRRRSAQVLRSEIAAGQHLQLPLYAMAVEELARQGALSHLQGATTTEVSLEFPRDPTDPRWAAVVRLDQGAARQDPDDERRSHAGRMHPDRLLRR